MPERVICYMHIPKCGGTTMRDLAELYVKDGSEIFDCYWAVPGKTIEDLLWMSDKERERIKLLYGHFFFGTHKLFERPASYMTVLREPVSRVMSQYRFQYLRTNEGAPTPSSAMQHFKSVLCSGDFQYNNLAARMISGFGPSERTDAELLETALSNIDKHFSFVGALEDVELDQKLRHLLAETQSLRPVKTELLRKNVNSHVLPQPDEELFELIESRNKADLQLYARLVGAPEMRGN